MFIRRCLEKNLRRWDERFSTSEIIRTYGKEYKCIFVGDASMSPYEILAPGGGNEHFNEEPGSIWLERAINQWSSNVWINPVQKENWEHSHSTTLIREIFQDRMVPLSINGIEAATKILSKKFLKLLSIKKNLKKNLTFLSQAF